MTYLCRAELYSEPTQGMSFWAQRRIWPLLDCSFAGANYRYFRVFARVQTSSHEFERSRLAKRPSLQHQPHSQSCLSRFIIAPLL